MEQPAAEQLISDLYRFALGRKPGNEEFQKWVKLGAGGMKAEDIVRAFYTCDEYRKNNTVKTIFPPGHYHSPVVDPRGVGEYIERERRLELSDLAGIPIDIESMRALWLNNLTFIQKTPFTDRATPENRYSYLGGPYPWGDAITLRMMIGHFRPRRIIEIGSGYSTACMLDSIEHASIEDCHITCIEPFPDRLRSLLRSTDFGRVTIIEKDLQKVSPEIVESLEANDILFIDSTHVMKTGSDVHYEFFRLLPKVRSGVLVHFHDVGFPFEYPNEWIFDLNYSWNEAYVLRAFLMYNLHFAVLFWNSLFGRKFTSAINAEFPTFLKNPGSSIWLRRQKI